MYIKYHGFKCECGEIVAPDFYELHFDMIAGEILDSYANEIVCKKCGAVYLHTIWVRVCPTEDGEYVELGRG